MTEANPSTADQPRIGMVATVRNRRGVISAVRPFDGPDGRLHLVDVEYNDGESPLEQSLLWEREPGRRLLPATALPDVAGSVPMNAGDLLAMVRACRWSSRVPYLDPDGSGPLHRLPASSPFHGAVQVEDFQLVPLLKALRMPRVSLLIADDVGLGKTIEAGLILTELLLRRRIRRVLIATPAALRVQWRDEMWEKFSLDFEIVDRDSTLRLRRQLGMDANPWRSHSRIITSYHYLKQSDILEDFRTASRPEAEGARLPWDLLILDEAHNLTPVPFGEESDLCTMLRQISPLFEHRIFLTATPHNGHTRSFTGLLEMLDPVRFSQTDELRPAERARIEDVLVRRLKREINARTNPPRFCERLPPQARPLRLGPEEQTLYGAFGVFRDKLRALVQKEARRRRLAGTFAVEILKKRLLSCPVAFADSWRRCRVGMGESDAVTDSEVLAARRSLEEETVDDREAASLGLAASATVGAWLKPMAADLGPEIAAVDAAVKALGLSGAPGRPVADIDPTTDARYDDLRSLVDTQLREGSSWRDDERLVVFTEYKTTLDYLLRRLRLQYGADRILYLYGGMDESRTRDGGHELTREEVKADFNDPTSPVRILVATDAASEGLDLQTTARYVLHYDIPWNPARLEQRNGRLDRHGQARDVTVWHFVSDDEQDLKFLSDVVKKVDAIREDLGATGEVFDELTHRRLVEGAPLAEVSGELDRRIAASRKAIEVPRDDRISFEPGADPDSQATPAPTDRSEPARGNERASRECADAAANDPDGTSRALATLAAELDFSPEALRTTLDSALGVQFGRPRLSEPDGQGLCRLLAPHPPAWAPVIDDTLRFSPRAGAQGALRHLAFDPAALIERIGDRPVFRPRVDTALLHLGHPMLQRALTVLSRQRFPGAAGELSRWTVSRSDVPPGAEALLLLTVEEIAVNDLRETFHHWVRTLRLPLLGASLGDALPHAPPGSAAATAVSTSTSAVERARDMWVDVIPDVRDLLRRLETRLTEELRGQLEIDRERAVREETERYQSRQGEVSALIESSTLARLERAIADLRQRKEQGTLWDEERRLEELDRDIAQKQEEVERRKRHYEEVRQQLAGERQRILERLLPRRHALRSAAQVLPVAVEIVLPDEAADA